MRKNGVILVGEAYWYGWLRVRVLLRFSVGLGVGQGGGGGIIYSKK